jgi:antitoxin (DNA-binding transcriptional repressor) of toxin-antitoxin stability system
MTTVTVAEARENLPELLRRAAAGEQIVITEGGKWLAALGAAPPMPPTPEEIAASEAQVRHAILTMLRQQIADGNPPPKESKIWELLTAEGQE